jgi:photosystem II stability/assembly factor-like uncharacterized protein
MKKVIVLLVALVGMISAMAQWVPQNSGTTNDLKSVYFTDELTGYAVGNSGTILKTTNGGDNWEAQNSGTTMDLNCVHFPVPEIGYAVGGNIDPPSSLILKTTNGGTNWIPQNSGISDILKSVYFTEAETGYAVGSNGIGEDSRGVVIKTTNGGNQWDTILTTLSHRYSFNSIFFPDATSGYVVGRYLWMQQYGFIYNTTDGGINWSYQDWDLGALSSTNSLNSIFFPNVNTGFAVGQNEGGAWIIKTTNAGSDWDSIFCTGFWNRFNSVYFTDASTGYTVGESETEGIIYKTTNGGSEWTSQTSGTLNPLYSVYFTSTDIGYIVGANGTILKTTNGGYTGISKNGISSKFLNISPNPAQNEITILSPAIMGNAQLSIFTVSGEKVLERRLIDNETQIDVSALPQGVYFVRVQDEKGIEVGKIIKQ